MLAASSGMVEGIAMAALRGALFGGVVGFVMYLGVRLVSKLFRKSEKKPDESEETSVKN